jgi:hypothetical protein
VTGQLVITADLPDRPTLHVAHRRPGQRSHPPIAKDTVLLAASTRWRTRISSSRGRDLGPPTVACDPEPDGLLPRRRYTVAVTDRTEFPVPRPPARGRAGAPHLVVARGGPAVAAGLQAGARQPVALESGEATPSSGDPHAEQSEHAPPPGSGLSGNPATSPVNNQPLRHGVAAQTPNREIRGR